MKHFIKCLVVYLVTIGMVQANLPPTTLKGQAETTKPTTFNFEVPYNQATTTAAGTRLIETGNSNVIKDAGFEGNSLQWVTYSDASGNVPVDGTGGTANVTVAYTTTNPLNGKKSMLFTKDAANRQGQGTSINFTIPDINKGKVNNIKISYDIVSGTYATGDLTMWVINVDPASASNGRVIQPSAYTIEKSGLKESKFLEFQSDIDSNLYRLVIHVTSTSASAYSLRFDDVSVGLGEKIYGSVATDWFDFTPTGNWTTNTTYTGKWRRVGDVAEIEYKLELSGAPNTIGLKVYLPTGLSADLSKYVSSIGFNIGRATVFDTGIMTYPASVFLAGTNTISIAANGASGTYVNEPVNVNSTVPFTLGSGDTVTISAQVKILGWSSSQQLSNDADTRVIAARVVKSSNQSIGNASNVKVTWDSSPIIDTSGIWDSVNNRFIAKVSGTYRVSSSIVFEANGTNARYINIFKNGVNYSESRTSTSSGTIATDVSVVDIVQLNAGDTVEIQVYQNSGGALNIAGTTTNNHFSIERISGPSQIAASGTVSASYYLSANFTASTTTPINFDTKEFDSHNAVTTSPTAWKFTAPVSGVYDLDALFYNSTSFINYFIYKNGTIYKFIGNSSNTTGWRCNAGTSIRLLAGEYIDIRPSTSDTITGAALSNSAVSYISISRTGNY